MVKHSKSIGLLTGAALVLIAATPLTRQLTLQPTSKVWVAGTSSLKSFKCETKALSATLLAPDAPVDMAKLVTEATVGIEVARLECGNGTMNDHMRKALKVSEFPTISFKLDSYAVVGSDITLKGMLTMAGQERPIELAGTVTEDGDVVHTTAIARINMKDWGVKPPSLMMGTMKVKELATIGYDVSVKR